MSKAERIAEIVLFKESTNLLDYLNEDCWRLVLSYVPVRDIVRSERVSRWWQRLVLEYLQGIRFSFWDQSNENYPSNAFYWKLSIHMYESVDRWTYKLGATVVAITIICEFDRENLEIIRENCPNLEALALINLEEPKPIQKKRTVTHSLNKHFKALKRVSFRSCTISEQRVSQYTADCKLEELEFWSCMKLQGEFLNTVNFSNMKSLVFMQCLDLHYSHILTSTNQLCELTKLVLKFVPSEVLSKIQWALDRMPKLEQLELFTDQGHSCLETYEPLCQLSHLKHLKMDLHVTDDSVEAITRRCKELIVLILGGCDYLNLDGVQAIYRNAGERLTELGLLYFFYMEDELIDCIRRCPKLTKFIAITDNRGYAPSDLRALASAARQEVNPGHVLTLDLSGTFMYWNGRYYDVSDQGDDETQKMVYTITLPHLNVIYRHRMFRTLPGF